jgi:hypothetical protein
MFNDNEQNNVVLAFSLAYEALEHDVDTTKHFLLEKWLPLIPLYTSVYIPRSAGGWVNFNFRFLFSIQEFESALDMVLDMLMLNLDFIKSQGKGVYLWDFEIFIEYQLTQRVLISPEQLKLIVAVQSSFEEEPFISISLNSSSLSADESIGISELETVSEDDCGEYYQLVFQTSQESIKQTIINNWNNAYGAKYTSHQYLSLLERAVGANASYVVLSIKTEKIGELFEWNEIQTDLFNFIKQQKDFLDDNHIKIVFDVYNCCGGGGEIGYGVIQPLIEMNIDLLITRSLKLPFNRIK